MPGKPKIKTYNDGIVRFYKESPQSNKFGAKINVSDLEGLSLIEKLNYAEASRRTQDLEFAEQSGWSLSLKIRVPLRPKINNKCKAIINNYLYDVKYVDTDRRNRELYVYLEGVREIHAGST